ncbi:23795_t:CDS:1, partial [Dentiscutata erythropus]
QMEVVQEIINENFNDNINAEQIPVTLNLTLELVENMKRDESKAEGIAYLSSHKNHKNPRRKITAFRDLHQSLDTKRDF